MEPEEPAKPAPQKRGKVLEVRFSAMEMFAAKAIHLVGMECLIIFRK